MVSAVALPRAISSVPPPATSTPSRFEGVRGRIHGTFGLELRALEFQLWGLRRGKLGVTTDLARRYRNIGLSVGFWH